MLVDIEKLIPNDWNPNSMSELKFNALVAGIKEENWNRLFPIEVRPEKNWVHVIIDWEHRYKALVAAGIKQAHIEISDLENGYEKLRTISKNSIHWTHDQIEEANLIKDIKEQGITDSEILEGLWIDEKELIAIDNLANFDIDDFSEDENLEDLIEEEKEEEEIKKEITLELNEEHYDILEELVKITETWWFQEAILITAKYFQILNNENKIDETILNIAKENLFNENEWNIDF